VFTFVPPGGAGQTQGELSADGKTLLNYRLSVQGALYAHWINLPYIQARSTPELAVYGVWDNRPVRTSC